MPLFAADSMPTFVNHTSGIFTCFAPVRDQKITAENVKAVASSENYSLIYLTRNRVILCRLPDEYREIFKPYSNPDKPLSTKIPAAKTTDVANIKIFFEALSTGKVLDKNPAERGSSVFYQSMYKFVDQEQPGEGESKDDPDQYGAGPSDTESDGRATPPSRERPSTLDARLDQVAQLVATGAPSSQVLNLLNSLDLQATNEHERSRVVTSRIVFQATSGLQEAAPPAPYIGPTSVLSSAVLTPARGALRPASPLFDDSSFKKEIARIAGLCSSTVRTSEPEPRSVAQAKQEFLLAASNLLTTIRTEVEARPEGRSTELILLAAYIEALCIGSVGIATTAGLQQKDLLGDVLHCTNAATISVHFGLAQTAS